jgi:hypothetical protein
MTKISRMVALAGLGLACCVSSHAALAQSRGSQTSAANDGDRLICRRVQETGSLVRTIRQCFTRAEWDRIAETARRGAQRTAQELSGGFNGNN